MNEQDWAEKKATDILLAWLDYPEVNHSGLLSDIVTALKQERAAALETAASIVDNHPYSTYTFFNKHNDPELMWDKQALEQIAADIRLLKSKT